MQLFLITDSVERRTVSMYQSIIHVYAFTSAVTKACMFQLACYWAHKWVQTPVKKLKFHSSITTNVSFIVIILLLLLLFLFFFSFPYSPSFLRRRRSPMLSFPSLMDFSHSAFFFNLSFQFLILHLLT
jgi:hypothetical protein